MRNSSYCTRGFKAANEWVGVSPSARAMSNIDIAGPCKDREWLAWADHGSYKLRAITTLQMALQ